MELGIFADVFPRPTLEERFAVIAAHRLRAVQLNLTSVGVAATAEAIAQAQVAALRRAAEAAGVRIAALSGTFNMIHPDPAERERGLDRLAALAVLCRHLGAPVITLCTGTRDPDDMWRHHPDNALPDAWRDLLATMTAAVEIAERAEVRLAFEPEPGNVVRTARQARTLIDQIGSARLGAVFDPANLFAPEEAARLPAILDEAIDLLGERIMLAHGKDRDAGWRVRPAGQGIVPWARLMPRLIAAGYAGPLILHGLAEVDVPAAVAHLEQASRV